jgi:hypothetical protein
MKDVHPHQHHVPRRLPKRKRPMKQKQKPRKAPETQPPALPSAPHRGEQKKQKPKHRQIQQSVLHRRRSKTHQGLFDLIDRRGHSMSPKAKFLFNS